MKNMKNAHKVGFGLLLGLVLAAFFLLRGRNEVKPSDSSVEEAPSNAESMVSLTPEKAREEVFSGHGLELPSSSPGLTQKSPAPLAGESTPPLMITSKKEEIPAPPESGCAQLKYENASKGNYKKNFIAVDRFRSSQAKNWKNLCVRVDGVPVEHRVHWKEGQVEFGAVRKTPRSVEVSFCWGTANCSDACRVPRDEFMEALAGTTELEEENSQGWNTAEGPGAAMLSREEGELQKELSAFAELLDEDRLVNGSNRSWKKIAHIEACPVTQVAQQGEK